MWRGGVKVSYIFPQFLVPSQAFALSDILALKNDGHAVTVYTIKPPAKNQRQLDLERGIPPDLPVMRPALGGTARWLKLCWRSRAVLWQLSGKILKNIRRQPRAALGALLALPRCAEIAEHISTQAPDVVHLFWSRHASLIFPILKSRHSLVLRSAFVGAYDLVADDFLTRMAIEEADVLFTHAEANRPYLSRRAQASMPLNVVHRGIPISIDAADSPQRDRNLWLTAAALYPSKNVASVIRAFARAYGHDAKLRLEIFGDGPDRARLEKLAVAVVPDGAVRFWGHVSRENLMARMQQAALFLLLSTKPSERLPNVIKEAMLAGCSIIVSQSEGIEELIPDTALGKIVNADDEPAIDRAVAELAGEPADAAAVRRTAARHLIEQKFSAAHSMQQYCAAWAAARSAADGPALPMGTAE